MLSDSNQAMDEGGCFMPASPADLRMHRRMRQERAWIWRRRCMLSGGGCGIARRRECQTPGRVPEFEVE